MMGGKERERGGFAQLSQPIHSPHRENRAKARRNMGQRQRQRHNPWDGGHQAAKLGPWTAAVGKELVGPRHPSVL